MDPSTGLPYGWSERTNAVSERDARLGKVAVASFSARGAYGASDEGDATYKTSEEVERYWMAKIASERRAGETTADASATGDVEGSTVEAQKRLPIDWDERAKRRAAEAERYGARRERRFRGERDRERERGDLARARARARRHERVRVAGGGVGSKIDFVAGGGSRGVRGGGEAVARARRQMSLTSLASSTSRDERVVVILTHVSFFSSFAVSSSRRARRVRRVAFRRRSLALAQPQAIASHRQSATDTVARCRAPSLDAWRRPPRRDGESPTRARRRRRSPRSSRARAR